VPQPESPGMAALKIRRLGFALGAEITGVDLSRSLDAETIATIRQAWLDHIVLCFPNQQLDLEEFRAFCKQFGPLDDNRGSLNSHPEKPEVQVVSSKPIVINGMRAGGYGRADFWHTDRSHLQRPTSLTFLLAKELPDVGGDTLFANQYMAYETLSPAFQRAIDPLLSVQDYTLEPVYEGNAAEVLARRRQTTPPVVQQLVRPHPDSGRRALYVGIYRIRNFVGMTEEETKPLLDFLNQHATRYEFTYRHRWSLNDLVAWDNRGALHLAVQDYDDRHQMRRMIRCAVLGPTTGRLYSEYAEAPLGAGIT
jgi:taurine dioxygenase